LLRKLGVPVLTVSRVARPLDFKRILFATDFGPDSESAFHTALGLASEIGSVLVVTHTIDKRPAVIHETPEVKKVFDEERERDMKEADDRFEEFRAAAAIQNVDVECVLAQGDPSEALLRIADEHDVDFMVLGLREKGVLARTLLGSTAEPIIRSAHVPVLSVPIDGRRLLQKTG